MFLEEALPEALRLAAQNEVEMRRTLPRDYLVRARSCCCCRCDRRGRRHCRQCCGCGMASFLSRSARLPVRLPLLPSAPALQP